MWLPKLPAAPESSPARPSSPKRRRIEDTSDYNPTSFQENCLNRDYLCRLTKDTYSLEASPICPLSLAKQKQDHPEQFIDFAPALSVFWSTEKVDKWLHSVKKNAETVANSITLTPSAHQFWDKALLALWPIFVNHEETEMRLSFYWLKAISPLEQGPSMLLPETITDDYIIEPPILPDYLDSGGRDHHENLSKAILMLFDCEGCNVVSSGNDIIITTPDPDHLPLPDEELLWMQLTLHRLTALCAAAGFQADFSYEDDDFAAGACIMTPPSVHEEVHEEVVKNLAYPSSYRKCSSKPFPRNLMFLDTSSGWNAVGRVLLFSSLTISLCMKRESWILGWYRRYTIL